MIVVANPAWAEDQLRAGALTCPHCPGALRPYGYARCRMVRGLGSATVTARPRRARCRGCSSTQVLLPATMTYRRADSTEAIVAPRRTTVTGAMPAAGLIDGRLPTLVSAYYLMCCVGRLRRRG